MKAKMKNPLSRPFSWTLLRYLVWCYWLGCGVLGQTEQVAQAEEPHLADIQQPIVSERNLLIREVGEVSLYADMFRPDDEAKHPLVMMIHGGAWSAGDKWELIDHARELAQAGFVAVSINYRLAPKFKIQAQVEDCRYALNWAVQHADEWSADTDRLGLWGYSAGAHLAALLALNPRAGLPSKNETDEEQADDQPGGLDGWTGNLPKVRAVVAGGAPCEFSFIGKRSPFLIPVMGGTRAAVPDVYREMSPVEYVTENAPPFFLFHGKADILVPPSSSQALYDALSRVGVEVEYYSIPRRGHWLTFIDNRARRRAVEFLSKHLHPTP
jgi:acetyl esterase/lipase